MKKIFLASFTLFSFLSSAQLSNGLLVHYELNGNATDVGPNQLNGTISGAVSSSDRNSTSSSAMQFDGVDDYIDLPNSSILKPQFPLSIAFWIKLDESEASSLYFSEYIYDKYYGFWVSKSATNEVSISFGNGGKYGSSSRQSKITNQPMQIGVWQHMVFIIRSATDMDIYFDCQNMAGYYNGGGGSTMVYSNGSPRLMSTVASTSTNEVYLKGSMDDLMIWNRALLSSEIPTFCQINSIEENKLDDLVVYPNPLNDILKIKSNSLIISKVSIFDTGGKLVLEKSDNFDSIDIKSLNKGVYFLKIQDSNSENTYKIVKD